MAAMFVSSMFGVGFIGAIILKVALFMFIGFLACKILDELGII